MRVRRVEAWKRGGCRAASTGSGQPILWASRSIYDRPHLMVVPSVRVVIHDHHCGAAPGGQRFQEVDCIRQEGLLVQRVRVARVPVLIGWRLDEAHGWQITSSGGSEEIVGVVLVVGWTSIPDFSDGSWTGVRRV